MNLHNYYYYFKSVIPPKICDEIIKYGNMQKEQEILALTGGQGMKRNLDKNPLSKQEIKNLKKKRNSNIVWMNDRWIYKEIQPYVNEANRNAGWNFEWDHSESCQFTKYGKGQYYGWHCDSWEHPYEEEGPSKGKIRKLSVTISLSNYNEYEGGQLEFDCRNQDPDKKPNTKICEEILTKGSLVVFPSFVWHRVKPVTKGVSLVVWNLGYPFK